MSAHKNIYIGMLGCGVVGSQVAALREKNNAQHSTRAGAKLVLKKLQFATSNLLAKESTQHSLQLMRNQ